MQSSQNCKAELILPGDRKSRGEVSGVCLDAADDGRSLNLFEAEFHRDTCTDVYVQCAQPVLFSSLGFQRRAREHRRAAAKKKRAATLLYGSVIRCCPARPPAGNVFWSRGWGQRWGVDMGAISRMGWATALLSR